jgi:hypothetical protein
MPRSDRDRPFGSRLTVLFVAVLPLFLFRAPLHSVLLQVPGSSPPQPKQAASGFEVTLLLPPDGLFAGEEMPIEFRVEDTRDAARQPVRFATIRARVAMPGMPGMPPFEEAAHREGIPGVFGVHPTFGHGGDYLLTLAIEVPSAVSTSAPPAPFQVQFPLTVGDERAPGASAGPVIKRFSLRVKPESVAVAGTPVDLEVAVINNFTPGKTPEGQFTVVPAPAREFEELHEKLLHLFIVRDDLGVFAHEHPDLQAGGTFRLQYRFPTAGRYRVFADVAPKHAGSQILAAEIAVSGAVPERFDLTKALAAQPKPVTAAEGTTVEWGWPLPLPIGRTTPVTATLRTTEGSPVSDLEPYLGAMGHLMLLHEDGRTFVHCHPDDRPSAAEGPATVRFLARFPKPGLYRGWGQFARAGRVLTMDFVVRAAE